MVKTRKLESTVELPGLLGSEATLPKISYRTTSVSPNMAAEWLKSAELLHKTNDRLVDNYARVMSSGLWKLNGEPIIFSDRGQLLDGHARLRACVRAQAAFTTLVIEQVSADAYDTIDSVRKRTLGDILHIRREPHGRALAAALTFLWRFGNNDIVARQKVPLTHELLRILATHPSLRETSLPVAREATPTIPLGMGIALHHLFAQVDAEKSREFFQDFIDGKEKSAPQLLRLALDNLEKTGERRSQHAIFVYSVKAWNAYYESRRVGFLRYSENEDLPKIAGLSMEPDPADGEGSPVVSVNSNPLSNSKGRERELGVEVGMVTPVRATELLLHNDGNRLIADGVVAKYKRDMLERRWLINGQTIKISVTGRLLDGQHRCKACIQSGAPFPAIVVSGIDEDAFDTLDLGGRRSFADVLAQRGEKHTAALAAALRWMWLHQSQKVFNRATSPTNTELDQLLQEHGKIRESLRYVSKLRPVIAPGMGVAMHYLFSTQDPVAADEFIERLCDGQNLNKDIAVWHLRERLLAERRWRKIDMPDGERWVLAIKAWNAMRLRKKISGLSWRGKGPNKEAYPEIA